MSFKLLILDVDGVLTNGRKVYDIDHKPLYKEYMCKDFTAIKRFIASGVEVVMISGDNWNKTMAEKRNIPFFCTRDKNLSLDKSQYIRLFEEEYGYDRRDMAFVGDDYFDLPMFLNLEWTFCPSDSPDIIKYNSKHILASKGGEGVLVELYDLAERRRWLTQATMESVLELDSKELSSADMSDLETGHKHESV